MQQDDLTPQSGSHADHTHRFDSIVLPTPTAWPMVLAMGLTLLVSGMVTHWIISLLGLIFTLSSIVGWFREIFPHENHISVPIQAGILEIKSTRTTREQLPVDAYHRKL